MGTPIRSSSDEADGMRPVVPKHPTVIEWDDPVFPPPPPGPMPPELAILVRSMFSYVPAWTESLRWCPWVLEMMAFGVLVHPVHMDSHFIALLRLVIAQDNSCRYCYGTSRMYLQILGYSEDFIRTLEHDLLAADLDPRRRAALDYARLVSRANPRPGDGQREALREHGYSDAAVAEIAAFAAVWVMENRLTTLGAIAPHPIATVADRWWMKMARPLLAGLLRRGDRNFPRAVVDPARRVAAFDDLIGALGTLPIATNLRKIVDAAFTEGPLPRRTRVLLTAVIGRALGCQAIERRLGSLLGPGDPDAAAIDAMLTRLDADWLDDRERLLVPVAREAARSPQPRAIQRRMHELRARLPAAELIDFVGVVSVACAVARLGMLLQRC
jgi:alkylhydroperoxidase family enzyme